MKNAGKSGRFVASCVDPARYNQEGIPQEDRVPMQAGSSNDKMVALPDEEVGVPQQVAPGVWRIVLPLPFALRWVNAYVLSGEGEWVLVDCGLGTRTSNAALTEGLRMLGIAFDDLTALVLTHAHPDHIGPSGEIAAAMKEHARVYMLDREIQRMRLIWGARTPDDLRNLAAMQASAGLAPDEIAAGVQELLGLGQLIVQPPESVIAPVKDGETVRLAGRDWRVIWTPGHASGHMCLQSEQLLLSGDHILPKISPNVSFYPNERDDPIQDHLDGLAHIGALHLAEPLVLPGHGAPFNQLAQRIEELRAGHLHRSQTVLATLQAMDAPAVAMEVTRALFAGRLKTNVDHRLALGETIAHLEHLRALGKVESFSDGSLIRYHAA
jgi:glyoxylase-like metal-dependent hydrolase (beta-lactamase superfamily II)